MAYKKLFDNIATAIESRFLQISARYGFDHGDEFEIALCELLTSILPDQYGVCRGFIVDEKDAFAGDDIIIYAKDRFPTIRVEASDKFSVKQEIPAEAAYCYIEAKHTLVFGKPESGQGFEKAFAQAAKAKSLFREKRDTYAIDPYTVLQNMEQVGADHLPQIQNPMYTAIIARHVKIEGAGDLMDALGRCALPTGMPYPDLVVAGEKDLLFPGLSGQERIVYESPFFVEGRSKLIHKKVEPTSALSVGIVMLLYALDRIRLGKMPYAKMIMSNLVSHPNK